MENNVTDFNLYTFEKVLPEFNDFFGTYLPVRGMFPPTSQVAGLAPPNKRVCRFCKKSSPAVKFNATAHVIPEFLGNRFLISDFECDECNSKFGKYETDFAAWLGAIRTMLKTPGKNGVPAFKPFKEGMSAQIVDFLNNRVTKISDQNAKQDSIKIDNETGKITLKFRKEAYTPIRVYKSLLKIALSIINENEIEEYKYAFDFLAGPDDNPLFRSVAKVMYSELIFDHQLEKPLGMLIKRISESRPLPLHFFMLYYGNFIFSFPIPFNQLDIKKGFYNGGINILFPPPVLFRKPNNSDDFNNFIQDFSQTEKVKKEVQTMTISLPPEIMKKTVSFDPKTGEMNPSSVGSSEIVGLYMVPAGTKIPTDMRFDLP